MHMSECTLEVEAPTGSYGNKVAAPIPTPQSHPTRAPRRDAEVWRASIARQYDHHPQRRRPRWLYHYRDRIKRRLQGIVEPGARVLDVGCGDGNLLASLAPAHGVGLDISERLIDEAKQQHPTLTFHNMCGEEAHTLGETFDYVIISQTLGEVYDLTTLFESIKQVCHERTRLVVVHYNRVWQPMLRLMEGLRLKRRVPEQNWLPADEMTHLLSLSGFEPIRAQGLTLAPVYVPILSSIVNRGLANLPGLHNLGLNYVVVARPTSPALIEKARPKSVSIVVPARNEAGHISELLARIPRIAERQQIIFVEGNSTDNTWEIIQATVANYSGPCELHCCQQPGKGKGDAVRTGFARATGDVLMILDADISVPPEELPAFFNALAQGHGEFINGSRLVYMMDRKAMRFLNLMGNKCFGWVFTYLLSQRFRDTLCGTKVLRRAHYDRIVANRAYFGDFDPFGDFDLLFGAARLNLKIVDFPVHYKARTYGDTNISRFRHGWMLLRMCLLAARKLKFV